MRLRGCFELVKHSEPPNAMYAGSLGGVPAWVTRDGRAKDGGVWDTDTYNLSIWQMRVPTFSVTGLATNVHTLMTVYSQPRVCVQNDSQSSGSACGRMSDLCAEEIDCGGCMMPETCGGGGLSNVCGCDPATPGCASVFCGSAQVPYDPCRTASCVSGVIEWSDVVDGTSCADEDQCNGVERCFGGVCVGFSESACTQAQIDSAKCVKRFVQIRDDGDPCTREQCVSVEGMSYHDNGECLAGTCFLDAGNEPFATAAVAETNATTATNVALEDLTSGCEACRSILDDGVTP
jgi:hypothetical protein